MPRRQFFCYFIRVTFGDAEELLSDQKHQILILEDDGYFRGILNELCSELAPTIAVADVESVLGLITQQSFNLLLLDWHLIQQDTFALYSNLENFQPNASRLALFTVPDLTHVITAMKAGASDVLWAAEDKEVLRTKIEEVLHQEKPIPIAHAFVSRLAESLTEKAMSQKTSLFQARREFSKTFLQQVLRQQKLRRTQLASFMSVSPRTLHRHLTS